jgi:hypothetical protein
MPIIATTTLSRNGRARLKLPVQAQSHKIAELEKWREAALGTARAYVQTRRRDVALGPILPRRPRATD